ncbi:MAG: S24/S26 family peptidase [Betaproteobacteria bacterium]
MPIEPKEFLTTDSMSTVPESADRTKNELAAEVLRSYGELRLRVVGSSMLPAVWPGDVLSIRHCGPEDAEVGDIVLFTRHGRLFAHRVVARTQDCLVTQGDGMAKADPPVIGPELVGRVSQIDRRGRLFRPAMKLSFGGRIAAAIFRRSEGAGRLLTRLHGLPSRASP